MTIPIPMRLVRYSVDLERLPLKFDADLLTDLLPFVTEVLTETYGPLTFLIRHYDRERVEKLLERSPMVRSYRAKEVSHVES